MLRLPAILLVFSLVSHAVGAEQTLPPPAAGAVDYVTQIAPLLAERCLDCHGPNDPESNLRLDRKAALLRGGDSGEPAIVLGNSAESHLIKIVAGLEPELTMPPGDEPLTPEQIGLLRAWIDGGADWPGPAGVVAEERPTTDHWAFLPLDAPAIPESDDSWVRNPIDAFIRERLQAEGLRPSPAADRATLIRRLYLDVLGLPPTPEAVDAFVADASETAVDDLIDRLLASRHYGENWARHWLDLVRFAETHGFETNRERPHAWRYRDYVIQSLNDDKPYDQFIREQIAGDSYGNLVALGYLVAGPYDLVKSPDKNLTLMQRQNELDDMINTTGMAFLGLTLGCARCHNHKFDPVTQTDYYAMQAVFAGVQHGDMTLPREEVEESQLADIDREIQQTKEKLARYFRPPVSATGNLETFSPRPARFVRFTIHATNSGAPCLDELAVYAGEENVALATRGGVATASGTLAGHAIHQLEHINDGKSGNEHSWISDEPGKGWIQIELATICRVDSAAWARDRTGHYGDRLATDYVIETSLDGKEWSLAASGRDRLPLGAPPQSDELIARFEHLSETEAGEAITIYQQLRASEEARRQLADPPQAYAGNYSQPGPTHRLYRGEPMAPREQVTPDIPRLFGELDLAADTPEQERRRALADWIASPENPLSARVIVNRIWQHHFGRPLAATPSDFGEAGVEPTHPELLDWLAHELIEGGWSLKNLHRLILQSATYQQASVPNRRAMEVDAATTLLWRYPPRRLEAEPIRDSILAVTGVLDLELGGPGFSGFDVEIENVRHYHPKSSYGPEDWRRMIYMTKVRMEKDAVFGLFDCPDAAVSVPMRSTSTTPLQALNLFNSNFLIQQSKLFAERLKREAGGEPLQQIDRAYRLCYGRSPTSEELTAAANFVAEHRLAAFCRAMLNSNEFLLIE